MAFTISGSVLPLLFSMLLLLNVCCCAVDSLHEQSQQNAIDQNADMHSPSSSMTTAKTSKPPEETVNSNDDIMVPTTLEPTTLDPEDEEETKRQQNAIDQNADMHSPSSSMTTAGTSKPEEETNSFWTYGNLALIGIIIIVCIVVIVCCVCMCRKKDVREDCLLAAVNSLEATSCAMMGSMVGVRLANSLSRGGGCATGFGGSGGCGTGGGGFDGGGGTW